MTCYPAREAPDRDSADDGCIRTDRGTVADARRHHRPVGLGLESSFGRAGAWEELVGKHHAMADEDLVLDRYAFADEGVGGDLAANADMAVLLDLDEGADLRSVTDRTPVQVHEIGVGEDRLGTKLNVPERHCPKHPC